MEIEINKGQTKCPICDIVQPFIYKGKVQRFEVISCPQCGLVFLDPIPSKKELDEKYTNSYANVLKRSLIFSTLWELQEFMFISPDKYVLKQADIPTKKILDVGCGKGNFLLKLKKKWDVYGIEVTELALEEAKQKVGEDRIFAEELSECGFGDEDFGVVTLWHTLEHLENANTIVKVIHRILKKGGLLFIDVPNLLSLSSRIFGSQCSFFTPEHILYFSKKTLVRFLEKNGFQVDEVCYPFGMPFTFARSLYSYCSNKFLARHSFLKSIVLLISLPISYIATLIACKFGKGEILRVRARKV